MTPAAIQKKKPDATEIRKEIKSLVAELDEIKIKANTKIVRLSNLVHRVQQDELYKEWDNPQTKKPFTSFQSWIEVEVKQSRSSVYRFIGVKEHLKLSDETLEKIGASRCFELVRVAKEKPKLLPRIVKEIEKNPDISVYNVQQMVTNVIAGHHFDSGVYERIDFAVKTEDVEDIYRALAVMQAMDPVNIPDSPSGRGSHLVALCNDFLSQKEAKAILTRLEKAGAFKNGNTNFRIEE